MQELKLIPMNIRKLGYGISSAKHVKRTLRT